MKIQRMLCCVLCVLLVGSVLQAQENETTKQPETVLLRIVEIVYGGASTKAEPKIIISKPNGDTETKALERASMLNDADGMVNYNQNIIRAELQAWQNKGFKIQSMATASPMTYLLFTTIVMVKD